MKKLISMLLILTAGWTMTACAGRENSMDAARQSDERSTQKDAQDTANPSVLVYGSQDYTRINPALDEHGEINVLIFDGLTAHNGDNEVVPGLAKRWEFDSETNTYTFELEEDVRWHDGEAFTAQDVKFTILPEHLLSGQNMQESDFFRHPIGTGPYQMESWDMGQAITLVKNENYFRGSAHIDRIIFKIVPDDSVRAMQMQSGELDLAMLTPKDAKLFEEREGYRNYHMKTSDYRGIMFNFQNEYWVENRDLIPAVCYALDKEAMVDAVLLGEGEPAYSPLQRNRYHYEKIQHYDYDPDKAREILEAAGCTMGSDGYYQRDGKTVGFVLSVGAGDQVRADLAQAAAWQLKEAGIRCTVDLPVQIDWSGQMAYLIGWGSPFDADDHTYKVFGTGKGANYSGYSNALVDKYLTKARQSEDPDVRAQAYARFQTELSKDPAFAFICYVDANYVATDQIQGIDPDTVMGHHGVGIFHNVTEWSMT